MIVSSFEFLAIFATAEKGNFVVLSDSFDEFLKSWFRQIGAFRWCAPFVVKRESHEVSYLRFVFQFIFDSLGPITSP